MIFSRLNKLYFLISVCLSGCSTHGTTQRTAERRPNSQETPAHKLYLGSSSPRVSACLKDLQQILGMSKINDGRFNRVASRFLEGFSNLDDFYLRFPSIQGERLSIPYTQAFKDRHIQVYHELGHGGETKASLVLDGNEIFVLRAYRFKQMRMREGSQARDHINAIMRLHQAGERVALVIDYDPKQFLILSEYIPGIPSPPYNLDRESRLSDLRNYLPPDRARRALVKLEEVEATASRLYNYWVRIGEVNEATMGPPDSVGPGNLRYDNRDNWWWIDP